MEQDPDTSNIVYLDEYRREHWLRELERARVAGRVMISNPAYNTPAVVYQFPERTPDDVA